MLYVVTIDRKGFSATILPRMEQEEAKPKKDATQSEIQEILRKRREMLNRVRSDLDKVQKLQQEFEAEKKAKGEQGT